MGKNAPNREVTRFRHSWEKEKVPLTDGSSNGEGVLISGDRMHTILIFET